MSKNQADIMANVAANKPDLPALTKKTTEKVLEPSKKQLPKTAAEAILQEPSYRDSTIYHYLLAHKLALVSDIEGIAPKDIHKFKSLLVRYKLPEEVSELDIRKADEICREWTRSIKVMKHGKG